MKDFMKTRIPDLILCVILSTGLVFPLFSGFLLEDGLYANIPLVIFCLSGITLLVEMFSYNRTSVRIGAGCAIAGLIGYLIYVRSANPFADEGAHSLGITLTLIVITGIVTYLLSRTRAGIIVLFVLGNLILAGSYFLQFPVQLWNFLLFTFFIFVMFLYRSYLATLMHVQMGRVRVPQYIRQVLVLCLGAFLTAVLVFFLVIRPLDPPTRELQLITKLENMDLLQVLGVSSTRELLDPSKLSKEEQQRISYTNQMEEEQDEEEQKEEDPEEENGDEEEQSRSSATQKLASVFYNIRKYSVPWGLIILAVIFAGIFAVNRYLKRQWRRNVKKLSPENQVYNYYQYFMERFRKAGFRKAENHTLYEYAVNMQHEMELFGDAQCNFLILTKIYLRTFYGREKVTAQELELFDRFYDGFEKSMKMETGKLKYYLKFMWV